MLVVATTSSFGEANNPVALSIPEDQINPDNIIPVNRIILEDHRIPRQRLLVITKRRVKRFKWRLFKAIILDLIINVIFLVLVTTLLYSLNNLILNRLCPKLVTVDLQLACEPVTMGLTDNPVYDNLVHHPGTCPASPLTVNRSRARTCVPGMDMLGEDVTCYVHVIAYRKTVVLESVDVGALFVYKRHANESVTVVLRTYMYSCKGRGDVDHPKFIYKDTLDHEQVIRATNASPSNVALKKFLMIANELYEA